MNAITAYPLTWPAGWRRLRPHERTRAKFGKSERVYSTTTPGNSWVQKKDLTLNDAVTRVLEELSRMGIDRQEIVISTNVQLRLDGLPKSGQRKPEDPGAAVYWRRRGQPPRCMAIDRYDDVADNVAAIAATLDAMRAIERHGGASILDRAFTGFEALPAPESWWQILGLSGPDVLREAIDVAHRRLAMQHHPDRGGDTETMSRINRARDMGYEAVR